MQICTYTNTHIYYIHIVLQKYQTMNILFTFSVGETLSPLNASQE